MSDTTKIEWTDYSWSPWEGCTKVSPGCLNCYAEARDKRHLIEPVDHWGKGAPRRRTKDWKKPVKWNSQAAYGEIDHDCETSLGKDLGEYRRPRVFPSVCDWLDDEVPIEWLADFLRLIYDTPNLDWLLLSKRPENFRTRLEVIANTRTADDCGQQYGHISQWVQLWLGNTPLGQRTPANVWVGTSVEDQPRADERVPALLTIPAKVRFLSAEPLLAPVKVALCPRDHDGDGNCDVHRAGCPSIHWLIIGGESGKGARPCNVEWIRDLVRQGKAAGVPVFVKQLGSDAFSGAAPNRTFYTTRHPKAGDPAEWPADLRVREFPANRKT